MDKKLCAMLNRAKHLTKTAPSRDRFAEWFAIPGNREKWAARCRSVRPTPSADEAESKRLKRVHGITLEQLIDAQATQSGICACCGKPDVLGKECDPVTKRFRAFVCRRCNLMIRRLERAPVLVAACNAYLARHKSSP